jgi:hypothetical protein
MHLYKASVDTGYATPYSTVLLSTIAGYSGYSTIDTYITRSGIGYEGESSLTTDVSGSTFGSFSSTMIFRVKCWPFTFDAGSQPDLDDLETLRDFLQGARFLWARFDVGSRDQPSATEAYPIVITGFSDSVNESSGTHGLELELRHKYKMSTY